MVTLRSCPTTATRSLVLLAALTLACDRGAEQAEPSDATAEPVPVAPVPVEPAPVEPVEPVPATPIEPQTFEQKLEPLTHGATPSADAEKQGWSHYKAKEYAKAQRMFALASLHDRVHWKHPFNLACASALAGDEATVKIALTEAVARDRSAASKKARSDADLARYRSSAWFEPVLRGEAPAPAAPDASEEPDAAGDPVEPVRPAPTPSSAGQPLPPGVAKPLAKAKIDQLRNELKQVHGLRPVVRGSVQTTNAEGHTVAWVVYDYSRYDACLLKYSKKACRTKLSAPTEDDEDGESDTDPMKCTDQWLARATFGATLVVEAPQPLKVACTANELRRFDLVDVDGDGSQEVVLDLSGSIVLAGFRDAHEQDVGRVIKILRLDGSTQFELAFAWVSTDMAPDRGETKRVAVRDVNGDGHLDLVIESVTFTAVSDGEYDQNFWPIGDAEDHDMSPIRADVWLYDPKADKWKK